MEIFITSARAVRITEEICVIGHLKYGLRKSYTVLLIRYRFLANISCMLSRTSGFGVSSNFWSVMTVVLLLLQRKAEHLVLEDEQEVHPQISVPLWDPATANRAKSSSLQMELTAKRELGICNRAGLSMCSLVDKRATGSCSRAEPSVRSEVAIQNI